MKYSDIRKASFLSRPNRFIAKVILDGKEETVHVKNTGRCRELLVPGCDVYLAGSSNPERKTKYDLIATKKALDDGSFLLINMDSQVVNSAVEEWLLRGSLFSRNAFIRREYTYGDSRFDFYIEDGEKKSFLEVKGVTLEKNRTALFPDAPTLRGVKHLRHLTDAIKEGYEAYVLFVIQMKGVDRFCPNDAMHPEFGEALRALNHSKAHILAYDCIVTESTIDIDSPIPVIL